MLTSQMDEGVSPYRREAGTMKGKFDQLVHSCYYLCGIVMFSSRGIQVRGRTRDADERYIRSSCSFSSAQVLGNTNLWGANLS